MSCTTSAGARSRSQSSLDCNSQGVGDLTALALSKNRCEVPSPLAKSRGKIWLFADYRGGRQGKAARILRKNYSVSRTRPANSATHAGITRYRVPTSS